MLPALSISQCSKEHSKIFVGQSNHKVVPGPFTPRFPEWLRFGPRADSQVMYKWSQTGKTYKCLIFAAICLQEKDQFILPVHLRRHPGILQLLQTMTHRLYTSTNCVLLLLVLNIIKLTNFCIVGFTLTMNSVTSILCLLRKRFLHPNHRHPSPEPIQNQKLCHSCSDDLEVSLVDQNNHQSNPAKYPTSNPSFIPWRNSLHRSLEHWFALCWPTPRAGLPSDSALPSIFLYKSSGWQHLIRAHRLTFGASRMHVSDDAA